MREWRLGPGRESGLLAGRRHQDPRCAIPVEHRGHRARPATNLRDRRFFSSSGIAARSVWRAERLLVEGLDPHRRDARLDRGVAERIDILGGGALRLVLDQALLEDERMRRVDYDEPADPSREAERCKPGRGAAPIVADQGEIRRSQAHRQARRRRRRSCRSRNSPRLRACRTERSRAGPARRHDGRGPDRRADFARSGAIPGKP